MKRIFLSIAGMMALLQARAQNPQTDTGFNSRKLNLEEINLVSSYYAQDGNNSAVTGGIGTEKLTDISNAIDIRLFIYDKKQRRHTIDAELGIDHYTSASSDMIDLKANSSASHSDTRIYPSLSWSVENEQKGRTFGVGVSASSEFDYKSFGANIFYSKKTKNKSGEFTAKLQAYLDQVSLVTPIELRTGSTGRHEDYPTTPRNSFSGSLSYSQIINDRLQVMLLADAIYQKGYLGLPFHRVYFTDGTVHEENLPGNRFKLPLGMRASYFLGDRIILKGYYRFYTDNWGLTSHTANLEVPVKITPFFSVSPFYRFYSQSAVKYFAGYEDHTSADQYYTSNYDLSEFSSHFFGAGIRFAPPKEILGIQHFSMVELRYGHYMKNTGMHSDIISLNLKFK
ncbi:DUF3570 domain-containing protein [Chitinophagaceae bacterium MMS25-I14]